MRLAAIFVGLVYLAVLVMLEGVESIVQRGDVVWSQALAVVLAVVSAGLLTSEIVLRCSSNRPLRKNALSVVAPR